MNSNFVWLQSLETHRLLAATKTSGTEVSFGQRQTSLKFVWLRCNCLMKHDKKSEKTLKIGNPRLRFARTHWTPESATPDRFGLQSLKPVSEWSHDLGLKIMQNRICSTHRNLLVRNSLVGLDIRVHNFGAGRAHIECNWKVELFQEELYLIWNFWTKTVS